MSAVLDVSGLRTVIDTDDGPLRAVDDVGFAIRSGECLALVGESGCGKSVTALSLMRLLPDAASIVAGRVDLSGKDLLALHEAAMRGIRGKRLAMIFQEPATALNPVLTIGQQIAEVLERHGGSAGEAAQPRAAELLRSVGVPEPERRLQEYPFQLSGGLKQRAMIAAALAADPEVLIADEPTTALDVTIQAQILELMQSLQRDMGLAIVLITHDLGVIAETCNDVVVMYAGRVAESGPVQAIFDRPSHPYTRGLLDSIPLLENERKTRLNVIDGMVPSLKDLPVGCRFQNRCPFRIDRCSTAPVLESVAPGHEAACHRWRELPPR